MPGILIMLMALLLGHINGIFKRIPQSKSTKGVIVSTQRHYKSGKHLDVYSATIKYVVGDEEYIIESTKRSSSYAVGQRVKIVYDANNPSNAIIKPGIDRYITVALLFLAGTIIAIKSFAQG